MSVTNVIFIFTFYVPLIPSMSSEHQSRTDNVSSLLLCVLGSYTEVVDSIILVIPRASTEEAARFDETFTHANIKGYAIFHVLFN